MNRKVHPENFHSFYPSLNQHIFTCLSSTRKIHSMQILSNSCTVLLLSMTVTLAVTIIHIIGKSVIKKHTTTYIVVFWHRRFSITAKFYTHAHLLAWRSYSENALKFSTRHGCSNCSENQNWRIYSIRIFVPVIISCILVKRLTMQTLFGAGSWRIN